MASVADCALLSLGIPEATAHCDPWARLVRGASVKTRPTPPLVTHLAPSGITALILPKPDSPDSHMPRLKSGRGHTGTPSPPFGLQLEVLKDHPHRAGMPGIKPG